MVCVSTLYVCSDDLSNGHEKLNPVPGNEARMVLRLKHISMQINKISVYKTIVPISRYLISSLMYVLQIVTCNS